MYFLLLNFAKRTSSKRRIKTESANAQKALFARAKYALFGAHPQFTRSFVKSITVAKALSRKAAGKRSRVGFIVFHKDEKNFMPYCSRLQVLWQIGKVECAYVAGLEALVFCKIYVLCLSCKSKCLFP